MKGILEFDLSDAEDREAHLLAVNATKLQCALYEVHNEIFRPLTRHSSHDENNIATVLEKYPDDLGKFVELADAMHTMFWDMMEEKGIKVIS